MPFFDKIYSEEQDLKSIPASELIDQTLSYYHYAISAHWATVASFVPTDVDVHIRQKIWQRPMDNTCLQSMIDLTMESLQWDVSKITAREVVSPLSGERMSGHKGEWYSIVSAAYGAAYIAARERCEEITVAVVAEMQREFAIFNDFRNTRDGIGALKAATVVAHNIGDLNRVIDAWGNTTADLKTVVEQTLEANKKSWAQVSLLNSTYMAADNHRHYPLREPRGLRKAFELFLPIGPFFDDWGLFVSQSGLLAENEIGEVAESLVNGWERLSEPVGYSRALIGLIDGFPGGVSKLQKLLPSRAAKILTSGQLRNQCNVPRVRFEGQWQQMALKALKS